MGPVIGISAGRELSSTNMVKVSIAEKYISAVSKAGGIPLVLPTGLRSQQITKIVNRLDGILITGGGDIALERYKGKEHPRVSGVEPDRDELEILLVQQAAENNIPCLGICRGIQVINVALGGTLYEDIGDAVPGAIRHDWYPNVPRDYAAHSVTLSSGSLIFEIIGGNQIATNSLHHQAIKEPAAELRVTGTTSDKIIEVVEFANHRFFLGVQWHPEWMQQVPAMQNIFKTFIRSSQST